MFIIKLSLQLFTCIALVFVTLGQCADLTDIEKSQIIERLSSIPNIQFYVKRFLFDPNIHWSNKRIFKLLITENIAVHSLTEETRKKWNIINKFGSVYICNGYNPNLLVSLIFRHRTPVVFSMIALNNQKEYG